MLRLLLRLSLVLAILAFSAAPLWAAEWPKLELSKNFRGPGFYLSWVKILACWSVFLCWVWTTDWVSRDTQEFKLDFIRWNPVVFGTFFAAFLLVWVIPVFWLALPLLLVAYVAPLATYIIYRNSRVTNDLRVLTPEHLRYWLAVNLKRFGVEMAAQAPDPHSKGPPVQLEALSGDERQDRAQLLSARQSPGLLPAREIIFEGLSHRASAIMLDYQSEAVGLRYMIDGVWLDREGLERETGDPALDSLKTLCGLNPQDRRNRQKGSFAAEYGSVRYASTLACQGTKTGERAVIQFEDKKIRFDTLDELGMRPKMQEQLHKLLDLEKGLLLLSAMPAAGLRSTTDVVIRHTDRFTREFLAVEDESNRYEEVENCPVMTYKAADGQTPKTILPKVFRMQPDVVVIRDLVDGETVQALCEEVNEENRLVISTVRAKDGPEALLKVLSLGAPPKAFSRAVAAVFCQRLVRKLCDACKESYTPKPEMLKQLGIPAGRVQAFYRPPSEPEEVCEECFGVGYKGRTAIFESLVVGPTVRKALGNRPSHDTLKQAARKDGMRNLQEEGVLLVAKGVTSLPELMRVLKQ